MGECLDELEMGSGVNGVGGVREYVSLLVFGWRDRPFGFPRAFRNEK